MGRRWLRGVLTLGTVVFAMACGSDDDEPEAPEVPLGPEANGTALWDYLQDENYTSWDLWPGKGELYPSEEPHGMLITTYVNDIALEAIQAGETVMPAGAIIVKENYMPDSTFAAITTMYKPDEEVNPATNNWFWLKNDPAGVIDVEGATGESPATGQGCIGCHDGAVDYDYVWTLQQESSS